MVLTGGRRAGFARLLTALVVIAGVSVVLGLASGRAVDWRPEVSRPASTHTAEPTMSEREVAPGPTLPEQEEDLDGAPPWWALAITAALGLALVWSLWRARRTVPAQPNATMDAPIADALRALVVGEAYEDTIIGCWERLEGAAAAAGHPRRAVDTVEDFSARLATAAGWDRSNLAELGVLYQRARYAADGPLSTDRERALACLARLRDDTRTE
ncbi:MAG: DUF4129 domain-containing protein [Propionibacteriaceae bacterium]|nr:DUF4129 domain-containing protein [Propionibacteriaceae bacterium]